MLRAGKKISKAKWLSLIPVIGGVCLASLKELDFAVSALVAACTANVFAAFKANENAKARPRCLVSHSFGGFTSLLGVVSGRGGGGWFFVQF